MANAGRAAQDEQAREDAAEEARRARKRAAQAETSKDIAAYNLSPLRGVYAVTRVIVWILIPIIAILAIAFLVEIYNPSTDFAPGSPIPKLGFAGGLVLIVALISFLVIFKWRVVAAGRAGRVEAERWLADLPFQLNGFFVVVGRRVWLKKAGHGGLSNSDPVLMTSSEPDVYFDVRVTLGPMSAAPPEDFMRRLLDGFGVPLQGSSFHADRNSFSFAGTSGADVTTQLKRIIEELLLPLHERYPLRSVNLQIVE
jgi:hypothetical protein